MDSVQTFGVCGEGSSPSGGITKMKNKKLKIEKFLPTVILVFFFLSLAGQTFAICEGPIVPCGAIGQPACEFCHILVLINNIINFILNCLTPIAAGLMLIIGGFYFLAAGPSPENVRQAKSVITAAVIGLAIVFIAWVFLNTFLDMIGVAQWTGLGTWWEITCP